MKFLHIPNVRLSIEKDKNKNKILKYECILVR